MAEMITHYYKDNTYETMLCGRTRNRPFTWAPRDATRTCKNCEKQMSKGIAGHTMIQFTYTLSGETATAEIMSDTKGFIEVKVDE